MEPTQPDGAAVSDGEEGHEALFENDFGRSEREQYLGARLDAGLAVFLVDMQGQAIDLLRDARMKPPAVLAKGLAQQADTRKGGIPPKVTLVTRAMGQLVKLELLDRVGILAVGKPEQEARQGKTEVRRLRQLSKRLPELGRLPGAGPPLGRIGRFGQGLATEEVRAGQVLVVVRGDAGTEASAP